MIKENIKIEHSVYIGSVVDKTFSDAYISVREKEQRIYSDDVVKKFPSTTKNHPQNKEWKLREKSTNRFTRYLSNNSFNSLLEIGCGNGWFSNQCSAKVKYTVGVDVNLPELEQASKLFSNNNLQFIYWDIFTASPFKQKFDIIVLNAVVQYFSDFHVLIDCLTALLNKDGEIHIIDSPFYKNEEIDAAKQRTNEYYKTMEVIEMGKNYFHHSIDFIQNFETLYTPETSKIKQLIKGKDMPFGWYRKRN